MDPMGVYTPSVFSKYVAITYSFCSALPWWKCQNLDPLILTVWYFSNCICWIQLLQDSHAICRAALRPSLGRWEAKTQLKYVLVCKTWFDRLATESDCRCWCWFLQYVLHIFNLLIFYYPVEFSNYPNSTLVMDWFAIPASHCEKVLSPLRRFPRIPERYTRATT